MIARCGISAYPQMTDAAAGRCNGKIVAGALKMPKIRAPTAARAKRYWNIGVALFVRARRTVPQHLVKGTLRCWVTIRRRRMLFGYENCAVARPRAAAAYGPSRLRFVVMQVVGDYS